MAALQRSRGGPRCRGVSGGSGYAVGAERRSPGGRPQRSAYRVRAVRWGVDGSARSCCPCGRSCAMSFVPSMERVVEGSELRSITLGHPLVDAYLEFVGARGAVNTWLATAYDLKVFFDVVGKDPADVVSAD